MLLLLGKPEKKFLIDELALVMMPFTVEASEMLCAEMSPADLISVLARSSVINCCSAVSRAVDCAELLYPARPKLPLLGSASGRPLAALVNNAVPEMEVMVGKLVTVFIVST